MSCVLYPAVLPIVLTLMLSGDYSYNLAARRSAIGVIVKRFLKRTEKVKDTYSRSPWLQRLSA